MKNSGLQRVIIMNEGSLANGIQIVFPDFRPVSFFEIDDDEDFVNLVNEIDVLPLDSSYKKEITLLLELFKDSLDTGNASPIYEYFLFNHSDAMDMDQLEAIIEVLNQFIEEATDLDRLMH